MIFLLRGWTTLRLDLKLRGNPVDTMKLRVYSLGARWALDKYTGDLRSDIEMYAKQNHPWTNRTGNAERGLHADLTKSGQGWAQTIQLSHGPDIYYGYYLENSMGKRFAVIEPTMRVFTARVISELGSIFDNIQV